ncbi:excinuclease ABC subunit UvrA [Sphingomonas aquatilis]
MKSKDIHATTPATDHGHTGSPACVQVRGARQNNLKNVDVDVPRDAFVVFTGISGSGKSSLAFGTLYAEAQRRYLESVAPYARRLIDQAGVPEVDAIDGLPPAVALQQQRGSANARSSVGSVTTLSSLVRMLYSRVGEYPRHQPMLFAEDFSPNTVAGACPTCHGIGRVYDATEETMVPDDSLTIRDRAIAAWPTAWHGQNLRDILVSLCYDVDTPWRDLPKKDRDWILFTEEAPTVPVYAGLTPEQTRTALKRRMEPSYQGTFTGARRYVLETFANTKSALMKKRVSQYIIGRDCPTCDGKRLKREALSVKFAGLDIAEFGDLTVLKLRDLLTPVAHGEYGGAAAVPKGHVLGKAARDAAVERRVAAGGSAHKSAPDVRRTPNLSDEKRIAAQRLACELLERLDPLIDLGLGYISLDRSTPTLSSGELQRLRLATQLSSQLFGVAYVLDEPSAGLHPADGEALLTILERLKAAGNSLFVVEHDLDVIRRAEWLVDVGPGAGEKGGEVLYSGPIEGLADVETSITRRYLFAEPLRSERTPRDPKAWLRLEGIRRNNLHGLDVEFPIGCFTAVTGVSGSGKSSLVSQACPSSSRNTSAAPPWPRRRISIRCSMLRRTTLKDALSQAWSMFAGWCGSIRNRSAARRARTYPPTAACSTMCDGSSLIRRSPAGGTTAREGSRSTSRKAAALCARARDTSWWSCCSCRAFLLRARPVMVLATTRKRSKSNGTGAISPRYSN